jgi:hypothetical protein
MCSNFRVEVDLNAPISRRSSAVTESRGLYPRDTLLTKKFEEELYGLLRPAVPSGDPESLANAARVLGL